MPGSMKVGKRTFRRCPSRGRTTLRRLSKAGHQAVPSGHVLALLPNPTTRLGNLVKTGQPTHRVWPAFALGPPQSISMTETNARSPLRTQRPMRSSRNTLFRQALSRSQGNHQHDPRPVARLGFDAVSGRPCCQRWEKHLRLPTDERTNQSKWALIKARGGALGAFARRLARSEVQRRT